MTRLDLRADPNHYATSDGRVLAVDGTHERGHYHEGGRFHDHPRYTA